MATVTRQEKARCLLIRHAVCFFSLVTALSACGFNENPATTSETGSQSYRKGDSVARLALEMDEGCADGWIAGREPRIFKTGYRLVPSATKAAFALAYANFLAGEKENLGQDMASYVPYSKRALFAYKWWEGKPSFKQSNNNLQNYWLHEALLDAGELYWRATEQHRATETQHPANSTEVIAHDTEQNMVCRFMESADKPGSREGFRKSLPSGEKE